MSSFRTPACSAVLLALAACSSKELWMGRRCGEDDCAQADAGAPADASDDPRACQPGRYQGSFAMTYRSGPAGVCGVFAQLDTNTASGNWSFVLEGDEQDGGLAFEAACLRAGGGGAKPDGGPATPQILAALRGRVDCRSGVLQADIEGTYEAVSVCDVGILPKHYFFRGTVRARYEPASEAFVAGEVRWEEPPVLLPPNPGGEGTWTAARVGSAEPSRDCLEGTTFRDDLFPDAGAP